MKRRSFLAGILALPFAPLVLGKEEVQLSRQHQKAILFGARYGTPDLPVGAGKTKYAFVVADTYAEARQYIQMAKAHPDSAHIRHLTVTLSGATCYHQLMGHRNCHIIAVGRLGRSSETLTNLLKVRKEAQRRNANWYYPPENLVISEFRESKVT